MRAVKVLGDRCCVRDMGYFWEVICVPWMPAYAGMVGKSVFQSFLNCHSGRSVAACRKAWLYDGSDRNGLPARAALGRNDKRFESS